MPLKIVDHPVRTAPNAIHPRLGKILEAHDQRVHLRCIDAVFWVIDCADPELSSKLYGHGFTPEPYKVPMLRGQW